MFPFEVIGREVAQGRVAPVRVVPALNPGKEVVTNNFPSSTTGQDGAIVPARQMLIEDDTHVFQKVCRDFFACDVNPAEHLDRHRQPSGRFGLLHELPGDVHRVKRHALAGARHMGKQAVLDRVVLGTVWRVVRDADLQPKAIGQVLQCLLEHMAIRRVGAAPIAQHQPALGKS